MIQGWFHCLPKPVLVSWNWNKTETGVVLSSELDVFSFDIFSSVPQLRVIYTVMWLMCTVLSFWFLTFIYWVMIWVLIKLYFQFWNNSAEFVNYVECWHSYIFITTASAFSVNCNLSLQVCFRGQHQRSDSPKDIWFFFIHFCICWLNFHISF